MKTTPACFLLVTPPENLPVNNGAKDSTAALQSRAPTAPGRCPHPTTSSNASSRLSPPLHGLLHRPVSSPTYSEPAVAPPRTQRGSPGSQTAAPPPSGPLLLPHKTHPGEEKYSYCSHFSLHAHIHTVLNAFTLFHPLLSIPASSIYISKAKKHEEPSSRGRRRWPASKHGPQASSLSDLTQSWGLSKEILFP